MQPFPERVHFTLFVPGTAADLGEWRMRLSAHGVTLDGARLHCNGIAFVVGVEWVDNPKDGSFGEAFSFGTVSLPEQRAIDAAPGAIVLSFPVDLHRARPQVVHFVRALAESGALAVRIEESKLGFTVREWIERVGADDPWSLYRASVVMLGGGGSAVTCGMRIFSLPDAYVELDRTLDSESANRLLAALCVYSIAEDPLLLSGHTFSPDPESPRRALRLWPDTTYPPSHACHNPFGAWRLSPPSERAAPPRELAYVFVPALVALLTVAEEQCGRPLSRSQVEEIARSGVCIALKQDEARAFTRARGYSDLDADLAWEQWCARAR
jgi:hypothetical protein